MMKEGNLVDKTTELSTTTRRAAVFLKQSSPYKHTMDKDVLHTSTQSKDILAHQIYSRKSLLRHKKVKTGVHESPKENKRSAFYPRI